MAYSMGATGTHWQDVAPSRVRFGVLGFAGSLSLITYLDRVCIMRAKRDIQTDLGFDDPEMGLVFSAFLLGYALFEVPAGWMGDVWGARRVLTRIVLCWSLFTALTGCIWRFRVDAGGHLVLDSLLAMLLVRFLFGIGEAGAYPNLTRVVGIWFPFRERARAQGTIWMSARLGGAIAPFVLGRLSVEFGWRQAFWILGLIGVAWCCVFRWWYRDTPQEKATCNAAERALIGAGSGGAHTGHTWPPWRSLVFSLSIWGLCLASCGVSFAWYFFPTWQAEYLDKVHAISYEHSEIMTGLPFLFGAVGCLLGGGLSDWMIRRTGSRRWGRSLIGCAGFTGAGLCVLATGFVTAAWQAVGLLCLAFLINDLAIPVIWSACADIGGRFAGTVSGIMNMAGGIGAVVSPMLIPRALQALPGDYEASVRWRIIFAGLAVSWFVAAAAWLVIDASRPLFTVTSSPERSATQESA